MLFLAYLNPLTIQCVTTYPGSPEREALKLDLKTRSKSAAEVPLLIGERTLTKPQQFKVCAPHDHAHNVANCSLADDEDVAQAIEQAVTTQKEWSRMPWEQRLYS